MDRRTIKESELITECDRRGFILLSSYHNNNTHVMMTCDRGHLVTIRPRVFTSQKRGCSTCARGVDTSKKKFYEEVADAGYALLDTYVSNAKKVDMVCSEGHTVSISPNNFKQGKRCTICANKLEEAMNRFYDLAKLRGDVVLSECQGCAVKLNMQCSEGHVFRSSPANYKYSTGCPSCTKYGYKTNKKGYLYILRSVDCVYSKIGITNNLTQRLNRLKESTPFPWSLERVYSSENGALVRKLEQQIHKTLPSPKFKGFDGATEWCYHTDDVFKFAEKHGLILEDIQHEEILRSKRRRKVQR